MTTRPGRLKASEIATLGPGRYHDGGGLYLDIKGGGRSWNFRFRRNGKLYDYGLGPVRAISLAEARKRAAKCVFDLYSGINPVEERRAALANTLGAPRTITFATAAEKYIASHAPSWHGRREEEQWRKSLAAHAFPIIGKLSVRAIDKGAVLQVMEPIWSTTPGTAKKLLGRIKAILDWAVVHDYRSEGLNPARYQGHLDKALPRQVRPVGHHPALPYAEIGTFMAGLRTQDGVAARALEFTILTAARSEEVLGARWSEINDAERMWIKPAQRTKTGKTTGQDHCVPLSDAALAIVEAMARVRMADCEYVFPGRNERAPLGHMALARALQALRADVTVHGFRSTFTDWAVEMGYPENIADTALDHAIGSNNGAYLRTKLLEQRRGLMQNWANRCAGGAVVEQLWPRGQLGLVG